MVVPVTLTGAPRAADSAASASARRGPSRAWWRSAGPTRCRPASRPRRAPPGRARGRRARRTGPPRVVGAEQPADVAEPGRGEHGVGERVRDDVAVGVPGAAVDTRPVQAGEASTGGPGSTGARRCRSRPGGSVGCHPGSRATCSSASARSWATVTLAARSSPSTVCTGTPVARTTAASSVSSTPSARRGVGGLEGGAVEALRRLHAAQRRPRDGVGDHAVVVDHDRGVDDGQHRHDGGGAGGQGGEDAGDDGGRRQRAGGVMHEDDVGAPGRTAASAARTDAVRVAPPRRAAPRAAPRRTRRAARPGRRPRPRRRRRRAGRQPPSHQRPAGQRDERLGGVGPQTQTTPGRCDDADSVHGSGLGGAGRARAQLARTSSSRISALSSLVPSASASSLTRI